jgi:cytochrome b
VTPVERPALRVWDPLVRVLHWMLVVSIALAWITSEGFGRWHEWVGYLALGVVGVRIVWGFGESRYARFADFVRSPAATRDYARSVAALREPRYIGHNPLGGWMVVALLASVAAASGTG